MLERFNDGVEITHQKKATKEQRNENRLQAIKEKFERFTLEKGPFKSYVEQEKLHNGKGELFDRLDTIDFSQANPRNNAFMNEMMFLGESFAEGFVSVWGIERDSALEKYKNQLQVIEQRNDDNTQSRFFVGTFDEDQLNKLTPFQHRKEHLQRLLDKQKEQQVEQRNEAKQEQTLELKREQSKEDNEE